MNHILGDFQVNNKGSSSYNGTGSNAGKTKIVDLGGSPTLISGMQYKRYKNDYAGPRNNVLSGTFNLIGGEIQFNDNFQITSGFIGFSLSGNLGLLFGISGGVKIGFSW